MACGDEQASNRQVIASIECRCYAATAKRGSKREIRASHANRLACDRL